MQDNAYKQGLWAPKNIFWRTIPVKVSHMEIHADFEGGEIPTKLQLPPRVSLIIPSSVNTLICGSLWRWPAWIGTKTIQAGRLRNNC